MRKIGIVLLSLILVSSMILAKTDIKMTGQVAVNYTSLTNNLIGQQGDFGLDAYESNTYLQWQVKINDNVSLTAQLTDFFVLPVFEQVYVDYQPEFVNNLLVRLGEQEIPIGRHYTSLMSDPFYYLIFKSYETGTVVDYTLDDLNLKTGVFTGSAAANDGKLKYVVQASYDLKSLMNEIDTWEIGANYFKDPDTTAFVSVFTQLKAYQMTADVEYVYQNAAVHGAATTNDSTLNIGAAYQLTPELEAAARYEIVKYNAYEPKIITVGANYALADSLMFQSEVILPQYDGYGSYTDAKYYKVGVKVNF